jgi:hypothetical protein
MSQTKLEFYDGPLPEAGMSSTGQQYFDGVWLLEDGRTVAASHCMDMDSDYDAFLARHPHNGMKDVCVGVGKLIATERGPIITTRRTKVMRTIPVGADIATWDGYKSISNTEPQFKSNTEPR